MTGAVTLYEVPNCDTLRKARGWLREHGIDFDDYRKQGITREKLQSMMTQPGWEVMLDNQVIIRRPILDAEGRPHVGFSSKQFQEIFAKP